MTATAPAGDAAPPLDLSKGAWGGAWTVVYGCAGLAKGLLGAWGLGLVGGLSRWGTASIRAGVAGEPQADQAIRLADVLDRFPAAIGAPLVPWVWTGAAICAACVAAGWGVVRRSDAARRAAILLLAVSAAHSVAYVVAWGVEVMPVFDAWIAEVREVVDDIQRANPDAAQDLSAWLETSGRQQLVWESGVQVIHLMLVGALIARLRSAECRAWGRGELSHFLGE